MTEQKIGFRDAIHVPYVVVTCDQLIGRGSKAWLMSDEEGSYVPKKCFPWNPEEPEYERAAMWHGVVDPFLDGETVEPGTSFRLFIRKECFKGLRHDFEIEVWDRGGTATCHSSCDVF